MSLTMSPLLHWMSLKIRLFLASKCTKEQLSRQHECCFSFQRHGIQAWDVTDVIQVVHAVGGSLHLEKKASNPCVVASPLTKRLWDSSYLFQFLQDGLLIIPRRCNVAIAWIRSIFALQEKILTFHGPIWTPKRSGHQKEEGGLRYHSLPT